ncbi:MAG TPA: GNAT family N-acetyltransferase [Sandaracinaceae bacterium]
MELSFRTGRPEDAATAAPLIHASGPAAFTYVFGERALELLTSCWERDEGIFGCGNHEVAVLEKRVVAVGAFYDDAMLRARTAGTATGIARVYGPAAPGVLLRAVRVAPLMPPPVEAELYVAHLAVEPALRGRGIMTRMLERRIEVARASGYRRMALDVARTNPGARRLYERLGFRVVELRRSTVGEGPLRVPDHYRMELDLGASRCGSRSRG